jgi:hypothetical protein
MNRDCFWLTDEQFANIEPHLPTDTRGKPLVDDRQQRAEVYETLGSFRLAPRRSNPEHAFGATGAEHSGTPKSYRTNAHGHRGHGCLLGRMRSIGPHRLFPSTDISVPPQRPLRRATLGWVLLIRHTGGEGHSRARRNGLRRVLSVGGRCGSRGGHASAARRAP